MARRSTSLFNLSFLDLLTSALGAVIFLFIITPKGGQSASKVRQAMVYFDTIQMKIHGELPDSLLYKEAGDTLLTVLLAYKNLPKAKVTPKPVFAFQDRKENPKPKPKPVEVPKVKEPTPKKVETPKKQAEKIPEVVKEEPKKEPAPRPVTYKGDAPSVPCAVSIEVNWVDKQDNVDLFVCRGEECVYGGRKRNRQIGQWDSGKSRNRWFGNDLRTNQEAVRQFDRIIPGEYKVYVAFKESEKNRKSIPVKGLIYTKNNQNQERGEAFSKTVKLGQERVLIGTIYLKADGSYQFKKS